MLARIAKRVPLFKRSPTRLVAEVLWQQDQYETHPLALRMQVRGASRAANKALLRATPTP